MATAAENTVVDRPTVAGTEATTDRRPALWRRLLDWVAGLFVDAPPVLTTKRSVALAAAAVGAGTLVSLGRIRGPGPFNSLFAEDGNVFLQDAWARPALETIFQPFNGYYLTGQRVLAELAGLAPVRWGPAVLTVEAALCAALLALLVFVASAGHLPGVLSRLAVSVPVAVIHVSQGIPYDSRTGSVDNNIATIQFPLVYATFWVLLWVPGTRGGRIVAVFTALACSFGTMLAVALVPIAFVRLLVRRDRTTLAVIGALFAGVAFQVGSMLLGQSGERGLGNRYDPWWLTSEYVTKLVPRALLGDLWVVPPITHFHEHRALLAIAWLVLGTALVLAIRRVTAANWRLAAMAAAASVLIWVVELSSYGALGARYVVVPGLLLIVTVCALIGKRAPDKNAAVAVHAQRAGQTESLRNDHWPIVAFATLLLLVVAVNYRVDSWRSMGMSWEQSIDRARDQCRDPAVTAATVAYGHGWGLSIPCDRVVDRPRPAG